MRSRLLLAVALLIVASTRLTAQAGAAKPTPDCLFSSFYRSSIGWESGRAQGTGPATPAGRGDLVGRVISARDGDGLADAHVRVMPGLRIATTDSAGRFAFRALPQGRYEVTVFGRGDAVKDSVTVGLDGLRVVAVLSSHTGDIVCTSLRQPSNERWN